MSDKLFIIGNGFDLAHGLPSRYQDYHQYLLQNGESWMANMLEFFFGNVSKSKHNLLWSDLEHALGLYEVEGIYDFLKEGHTLDLDHIGSSVGELDAEVEYHFVKICETFSETFASWCRSVDLSSVTPLKRFSFNNNDTFLTFNYTDTLEKVYGVNENQVLHIHGRAAKNEELIVGHNKPAKMPKYIKEDFYDHEANYRAIVDTINKLEKKTGKIIGANSSFFVGLNYIEEVTVLGHSMAPIDIPYFEKVKQCISNHAHWKFSYYNEDEQEHIDDVAVQLGILRSNYSTFQI